jgi:hypothetical protein
MNIRQGETVLLDAAVHFGDPRESDFTACSSTGLDTRASTANIERHTRPDPLWRVWLLVLLAALMVSWKFTARSPIPA